MEKYSTLSFVTQKELLRGFCEVIISLNTEEEAVKFLTDLLTKEEVIKLAKRIKIAQLLLEGQEYKKIQQAVQTGSSTVAKVAQWLNEAGDGFRLTLSRTNKKRDELKPETNFDLALKEWKRFKRRYPSMFWPSLLIEGMLGSSNKQQKDKMKEVFEKLDHKSKIYKEVSEIFERA